VIRGRHQDGYAGDEGVKRYRADLEGGVKGTGSGEGTRNRVDNMRSRRGEESFRWSVRAIINNDVGIYGMSCEVVVESIWDAEIIGDNRLHD
jgi:hypothetical protein